MPTCSTMYPYAPMLRFMSHGSSYVYSAINVSIHIQGQKMLGPRVGPFFYPSQIGANLPPVRLTPQSRTSQARKCTQQKAQYRKNAWPNANAKKPTHTSAPAAIIPVLCGPTLRKLRDNDETVHKSSRLTRPGMLTLSTSVFPSVACVPHRTFPSFNAAQYPVVQLGARAQRKV